MVHSGKRDVALQNGDVKRQDIAKAGEQLAAAYLCQKGYAITCRNWRSGRFAEIDLIVSHSSGLQVFVEVKTRRLSKDASPHDELGFSSIDRRKRRKILIAAASYLSSSARNDQSSRIDAIVIYYSAADKQDGKTELKGVRITHVESAFDSI